MEADNAVIVKHFRAVLHHQNGEDIGRALDVGAAAERHAGLDDLAAVVLLGHFFYALLEFAVPVGGRARNAGVIEKVLVVIHGQGIGR